MPLAPFIKEAQQLIVFEESPMDFASDEPVIVYDDMPEPSTVLHSHEEETVNPGEFGEPIAVFELHAVPGAADAEPIVVNDEDDTEVEEDKKDENNLSSDLQKVEDPKKTKWDLLSEGAENFVKKIKYLFDNVPKHSGQDTSGIERACSYLERLDTEISKCMRNDVDGELDANKVEEIRSKIDNGIVRLKERLTTIKKSKKTKKAETDSSELIKEAQKISGVQGTFVVVPLFISRLGRTIINGVVSGGHSLEDLFQRLDKKFKLSDREKAELEQFLEDCGYPIYKRDRGYFYDEEYDKSSSDNFDLGANYPDA